MAVSVRHPDLQTCGNCDRPAPKLAPLVRFSRRGLQPGRGPRPHGGRGGSISP